MRHRPAISAAPWAVLLSALLAAGCATGPSGAPSPTAPPAASAAPGLLDLLSRPAERALAEGMRAYDDGHYPVAEAALRKALDPGPGTTPMNGRDRAGAHKLLAFITCSTQRVADCETAFRAARAADPGFALTRSEAGHPLWGPVYRRVLPAPPVPGGGP